MIKITQVIHLNNNSIIVYFPQQCYGVFFCLGDLTPLIVTKTSLESRGVILNWQRFEGGDYRKLLGYIVSYIKAPFNRTVSQYDGRDACGGDG